MTRRVPPAPVQRRTQWQRSTFIGTGGGRVLNAYPVQLNQSRPLPGVASTGAVPVLWYRGDELPPGAEGDPVTSWPAFNGYGPTQGPPPPVGAPYGGPPLLHIGVGGQRALRGWSYGSEVGVNSYDLEGQPAAPLEVFSTHGITLFALVGVDPVTQPYRSYGYHIAPLFTWRDDVGPWNAGYFDVLAYLNGDTDGAAGYAELWSTDTGETYYAGPPPTAAAYAMMEWRFGGPVGVDVWRINGVEAPPVWWEAWDADGAVNIPVSALDAMHATTVSTSQREGDIYEVALFRGLMGGTQLASTRGYFAGKYGIPT